MFWWVAKDKFTTQGNEFPRNPKEGDTHYDTAEDKGWEYLNMDYMKRLAENSMTGKKTRRRKKDYHSWYEVMVRDAGWTKEKEKE